VKFLLLETNSITPSGRIYPKEVVEEAIQTKEFKDRLDSGKILGYIGQPLDTSARKDQPSHVLKDIYFQDNDLYGEIEVLDTSTGEALKKMIFDKEVRYALQGVGDVSVDSNGVTNVISLEIETFNLVMKI